MSTAELAAPPYVEAYVVAVIVLSCFIGWLLLHREEPTQRERDDDLREAGEEWGGDQ